MKTQITIAGLLALGLLGGCTAGQADTSATDDSASSAESTSKCLTDNGVDQNENRLIGGGYTLSLDASSYDKDGLVAFLQALSLDTYQNVYTKDFPFVDQDQQTLSFELGPQGVASDETFSHIQTRVSADIKKLRKVAGVSVSCEVVARPLTASAAAAPAANAKIVFPRGPASGTPATSCLVDNGIDANDNRLVGGGISLNLALSSYSKEDLFAFLASFSGLNSYQNVYAKDFPFVDGGQLSFELGPQAVASDETFANIVHRVGGDITKLKTIRGVKIGCQVFAQPLTAH